METPNYLICIDNEDDEDDFFVIYATKNLTVAQEFCKRKAEKYPNRHYWIYTL